MTIEFDGGSRGNPGPAGIGVIVRAADGTPLVTLGRYIGVATNNIAEYKAVIAGLEKARELGARRVQVRGDSELIIRQLRGEYRVKNPGLRPLYERAMALLAQFEHATLSHNLRHHNALADKLANLAIDRRAEVVDADESSVDRPAPAATTAGQKFVCARCGCQIQVLKPSSIRPHQLRDFVCQCGAKMG